MANATRATRALDQAGIRYTLHTYDYAPVPGGIGLAAAQALGVDAGQVFKTLMLLADGKPACVIAPSDSEVAMKRVAAALRAKAVAMMGRGDAERVSGYRIGGISPFGQTRKIPVVLDETALLWDAIFINGGQRGLQVRLVPSDVAQMLDAVIADILPAAV